MTTRICTLTLAVVFATLLDATYANAAIFSATSTAPTFDGADIGLLSGSGSKIGDIWSNQPAQGQTFMTGSNGGGYTLDAITIRSNDVDTTATNFLLRVGTVSGSTFTEVAQESGGPVTFISKDYITGVLGTPITLSPNTLYAFEWGSPGSNGLRPEGSTLSLPNALEVPYHSGSGGTGDNTLNFHPANPDRVFHLNLAAVVPEPSTFALLGIALLGLLPCSRRRNR